MDKEMKDLASLVLAAAYTLRTTTDADRDIYAETIAALGFDPEVTE